MTLKWIVAIESSGMIVNVHCKANNLANAVKRALELIEKSKMLYIVLHDINFKINVEIKGGF